MLEFPCNTFVLENTNEGGGDIISNLIDTKLNGFKLRFAEEQEVFATEGTLKES